MLGSIDNLQFNEWMVYAEKEPFGEERADLRMGILAATIVNLWRDQDKTSAVKAEDFMPKFESQPTSQSPEDLAMQIDLYFSALAARG